MSFFLVLIVFFAVLAVAEPIYATHGGTHPTPGEQTNTSTSSDSAVASMLTSMVMGAIGLLGPLLIGIVSGIIWVSQYNDFINALAVVNGWVIVRDVANMFFIIVLLIIAFGTILGQEEYHYKKLLPKLLILAVLVNFSRTIVGVMIDFSQVVMLTFVNGYKAAAGGNFANIFQIIDLMKFSREKCRGALGNTNGVPTEWAIFGAALLAFIMILVSLVTTVVIFAVLVLRIVMLWILIVLSPLAFLAGTFPQGQKYYAQWWEELKNYIMVGPLLAFFLWLSLVTVGSGNAARQITQNGQEIVPAEGDVTFACSEVGSTDTMVSFVIGTMMLLAGVQMAQELGGAISGIAAKAKGFATRTAPGLVLGAAKLGYKAAQPAVGYGLERFHEKTGIEARPSEWVKGFKEMREHKKAERRRRGIDVAVDNLMSGQGGLKGRLRMMAGMAGLPRESWEHFLTSPWKTSKSIAAGGQTAALKHAANAARLRQRAGDLQRLQHDPGKGYEEMVGREGTMARDEMVQIETKLKNKAEKGGVADVIPKEKEKDVAQKKEAAKKAADDLKELEDQKKELHDSLAEQIAPTMAVEIQGIEEVGEKKKERVLERAKTERRGQLQAERSRELQGATTNTQRRAIETKYKQLEQGVNQGTEEKLKLMIDPDFKRIDDETARGRKGLIDGKVQEHRQMIDMNQRVELAVVKKNDAEEAAKDTKGVSKTEQALKKRMAALQKKIDEAAEVKNLDEDEKFRRGKDKLLGDWGRNEAMRQAATTLSSSGMQQQVKQMMAAMLQQGGIVAPAHLLDRAVSDLGGGAVQFKESEETQA